MTTTKAILLAALVILGAGCARTIIQNTEETDYDPNDLTAELDFWHDLPGRSAVSNNEGFHGIILFFDGEDATRSYDARLQLLKDKGWLGESFDEPANMAMQRGTLSAALCKAMDIKGGVMMRLTHGSPRYAYKELVFLGIMPDGSDQMVVDGLDYVGVVSRVQDYLVVQRLDEKERSLRRAAEAEEKERQSQEGEAPTSPEREAGETPPR